jgi:Porin subfamily
MIRKSAWLGSAVLLLATQAAQAADLPVKVRPVDYVKVCTVYGAGFYYIPGTDTCLKIGGYLRSDHVYGGGNQGQYYLSTASARFTRTDTRMYSFRARANLTVDFRTQSDYGTIRAYASMVAQESQGDRSGTGVRIVDFLLPKDSFEAQINYSKGAIGYVLPMSRSTSYASDFVYGSSNSVAIGYAVDGVFTNGTGVELTQGWSVAAAYQHFWSPQWRTSVIGGFAQVNYDSTARGYLCSTQNTTPSSGVFGAISSTIANCNPNFSLVAASTRTAWTPHPLLDIGVDLIWNRVNTAFAGSTVTLSQQGARPGGFYQVQSLNDYILMMRLQKSVLP